MDEMAEYATEDVGAICEDLRNIAITNKCDLLAYIFQMIVGGKPRFSSRS